MEQENNDAYTRIGEGFLQSKKSEGRHPQMVAMRHTSFICSKVKSRFSLMTLFNVHHTEATLSSNTHRSHGNIR